CWTGRAQASRTTCVEWAACLCHSLWVLPISWCDHSITGSCGRHPPWVEDVSWVELLLQPGRESGELWRLRLEDWQGGANGGSCPHQRGVPAAEMDNQLAQDVGFRIGFHA